MPRYAAPITEDTLAAYVEVRRSNHGPEWYEEFVEAHPQFAGLGQHAIINRFRNELQKRGQPTDFRGMARARIMTLPEGSLITEALAELSLPYRDALIFCDPHIPHHSRSLMARAFAVAEAQDINTLVLAGDTFDFDCFSSFLKVAPESAEETFRVAGEFLEAATQQFEVVCLIMGNHDERILRRLDLKLGMKLLLDHALGYCDDPAAVMEKLKWTSRFYMEFYDTPDGVTWRISHPDNYRKVAGSVANEGAIKYGCHYLVAHEHHLQAKISMYGGHWAVNGGCIVSPAKTEYIQRRDKMCADWAPGFSLLYGGEPILFRGDAPESSMEAWL